MIFPSLDLEKKLWKKGYQLVCGIDEVGRGCFAGPVVVGAVIFPPGGAIIEGLADSKLIRAKKREQLAISIKLLAISFGIAEVDVETIDKIGIGAATQLTFSLVVKKLNPTPDFVLIDAFNISSLDKNIQQAVKDGDTICASIAAASIIAKVYRDKLMAKLDQQYPGYNFAVNKGYGTKFHREAIKNLGLSKIHRSSFNLTKFLSS